MGDQTEIITVIRSTGIVRVSRCQEIAKLDKHNNKNKMEGTNSKFARAIPIIAERFSIVNISLNITAYVIKHYFRTLK